MSDFKIGMKLPEVISKLKGTQQSSKTNELIFNFAQNDRDGIITNANELAMLNSWFSGSEKVKMPSPQDENFKETYPDKVKEFEAGTVFGNDRGETMRVLNMEDANVSIHINGGVADFLYDEDKDGYADRRQVVENYGASYYDAGIPNRDYRDENLNGELKQKN